MLSNREQDQTDFRTDKADIDSVKGSGTLYVLELVSLVCLEREKMCWPSMIFTLLPGCVVVYISTFTSIRVVVCIHRYYWFCLSPAHLI